MDACRHIQGMQMQTHAHRCKWTLLDERRANCIQFVGGHNLKTHPDIRRLFKDFRNVLQHSRDCDMDNGDATCTWPSPFLTLNYNSGDQLFCCVVVASGLFIPRELQHQFKQLSSFFGLFLLQVAGSKLRQTINMVRLEFK